MLYPSLFFKTHRALYYELLNEVRLRGDWERWLDFFAEGVQASATQAVATANALLALVNADRDRIAGLGPRRGVGAGGAPGAAAPADRHVGRAGQGDRPHAATVNKSLAHLERSASSSELTEPAARTRVQLPRYVVLLERAGTANLPEAERPT